ncbi:hypothetical protein AMTR_s00030p00235290 [Amborella trichopoda]|uniref:Uncharacterized protein n=1 Tax=Amborella trichopoda TaxID=13333 RepID=U5D441_AMBTC|nr:hypothetical protein AMTR_s00030p00235290 [Amborella trichopoda]
MFNNIGMGFDVPIAKVYEVIKEGVRASKQKAMSNNEKLSNINVESKDGNKEVRNGKEKLVAKPTRSSTRITPHGAMIRDAIV